MLPNLGLSFFLDFDIPRNTEIHKTQKKITTMASPKKALSSTKKKSPRDELKREINKLNNLLQDKLKIEHDSEEEEYKLLLKKMVGRRIRITVGLKHKELLQ